MNEYYEEDELEAERRRLVNEELEQRIELEKKLNTIAGITAFIMITNIVIIVIAIGLFLLGILKISFENTLGW